MPKSTPPTLVFGVLAIGAAAGLGDVVGLAGTAWRFGGGVFIALCLAFMGLVVMPIMVLEAGLGQRTRRPAPAALAELSGPVGEWVGWLALCNGLVVLVWLSATLGWILSQLAEGSVAALLAGAAAPWAVGAACARSPRAMGQASLVLVVALAAALVLVGLTTGSPAVAGLVFLPRAATLAQPEVWVHAAEYGLLFGTAGLGVLPGLGAELPERGRSPGRSIVAALVLATALVLCAGGGYILLHRTPLLPGPDTLLTLSRVLANLGAPTLAGLWSALAAGATLTALALLSSLARALGEKWPTTSPVRVVGTALVGATLSVAVGAVSDVAGAQPAPLLFWLRHWSLSWGLPLITLFQCLVLLRSRRLPEVLGWLDLRSRFKPGRWLPWMLRSVVPLGLVLLLAGRLWLDATEQVATVEPLGLPALRGVVHVVVLVGYVVGLTTAAGSLTWTRAPGPVQVRP